MTLPPLSLGVALGGLIRPEGIVVVLRAYLDDSGTDNQSPIVLMAGYVARLRDWMRFESRGRKLLKQAGVNGPFHAKEFQNNNGAFKGWKPAKQLAFVTELNDAARDANVLLGICRATQKDTYRQRGIQTGLNKNRSAYGWCFQMAVDVLLEDEEVGPLIRSEGISFVVEDGNRNNPDVEAIYERYKATPSFGLREAFRGIYFVPKTDSVAIQFADFLAYFTRRHSEDCVKAGGRPLDRLPPYLEIATTRLRHRGFVANDFYGRGPSGEHWPQT